MPSRHKIVFGDSRIVLDELEPESIALCVTSPPYFVGREYESYLKDEDDYWNLMLAVFLKMDRLVEPFGKVAINFPDRYANARLLGRPCEVLYAHKFDAIMQAAGFDLWARIIWDKKDVFTEGTQHLAHKNNKTGQMRVAPNWEYIFVWRKQGEGQAPIKNVDMTDEERIAWTDSIWSFSSVRSNENVKGFKLAKFPEELPYRFIRMYTGENDWVLDPFAGSCTVTRVTRNLDRNSICIERNLDMEEYIRAYLGEYPNGKQLDMFNESRVEFIK